MAKKKMQPMTLEEFTALSVSERMKRSDEIGVAVRKLFDKAQAEANKLLTPLGLAVIVNNLEFGEINTTQGEG